MTLTYTKVDLAAGDFAGGPSFRSAGTFAQVVGNEPTVVSTLESHSGETEFTCPSGGSFTVGFAFQVTSESETLAQSGTWEVVSSRGLGGELTGGGTWTLLGETPIRETWTGTLEL